MDSKDVKVGIYGIGLDTYWGQFEGLYDKLAGWQAQIASGIAKYGVTVVDAGMVDNYDKAQAAGELFHRENVELVFVYISTYALSSTVLPVIQQSKAYPVLLNMQPVACMDFDYVNSLGDTGRMTGEWLAHCQACSTPEIASVFNRSGIKYSIVSGYLADDYSWSEIEGWVAAAKVARAMRKNRMGVLGNYYGGMVDVYTDLAGQGAAFGTHTEVVEMCELKQYRDQVTVPQIEQKIKELHQYFDVDPECETSEIERAARTSVALDRLVESNKLGSLAYYYEGVGDYQNIVTSLIPGMTLLTTKNIPVAGEYEVKNVQAMKIMAELGAGGSFSEFYSIDFTNDVVMLGHDGPAHSAIAQGRVKLVPLPIYHGKPGKGLSIQMSVKQGPVTVLSVCEGREGVFLLVAQGESVAGPILETGNTNSRYKFSITAREFIDRWSKAGPSHHCAIGVGHVADKIEKYAQLINMPIIKIC